jgi:hypothetical protein
VVFRCLTLSRALAKAGYSNNCFDVPIGGVFDFLKRNFPKRPQNKPSKISSIPSFQYIYHSQPLISGEMRKLLLTTALVGVFLLSMAAIAGIDGKWVTTLSPGDGSHFEVTYTFVRGTPLDKTDGEKFTGDVLFPGNKDFAITNGTIKGDSIKFFVMLNGSGVPNYGRVYPDSIALDIAMNNVKHHHTLKRPAK